MTCVYNINVASIIPGDPELVRLAYQEEEHKAKAIIDEAKEFIGKHQASIKCLSLINAKITKLIYTAIAVFLKHNKISHIWSLIVSIQIDGEAVRLFGNPGEQIVKKAEDIKATLVITGSRGLGTIRRTVLGSVSDYVIHHSHVPVIVYQHH